MADPEWYQPSPRPSEATRQYANFHGSAPSEVFQGPTPTYDVLEHFGVVRALLKSYPLASEATCKKFVAKVVESVSGDFDFVLSDQILKVVEDTIHWCFRLEGYFLPRLIDNDALHGSPSSIINDVRSRLSRQEDILTNWHNHIGEMAAFLSDLIVYVLRKLPAAALGARAGRTMAPMFELLPNPGDTIFNIVQHVVKGRFDDIQAELFPRLGSILWDNTYTASGYSLDDPPAPNKIKMKLPEDCGLPLPEMASAYLKSTPFRDLLMTPVPLAIPDYIRFEHTHILGGSGHGKTTLLTQQILEDLRRPDSPGLIVIDGKGTFVKELQQLEAINASGRLVTINPQDRLFPPALNMFAPRLGDFPPEIMFQMEESAISNFQYIFGTRDFSLTAKQATCLSYCVRLLMSMRPVPTILTLLDLMNDPVSRSAGVPETSPFKPFIDRLSDVSKRYFYSLFYHPTEYGETKRQIQNRIFDLLEHPAFAAMFATPECKLDLLDIIQNRKILLVDSSPSSLGEKAAPMLGRYIIALTLSAAYARLGLPKSEWHPAFIVVDEAQMFVDEEKTQPLLQQAREFNLGVTLAHQKLADLTPTLTATLAANTSIRYVGGVSAVDAAFMARNMGCEPDFIMGQRKTPKTTSFACHVRGYTERAVSLTAPLGLLQAAPRASQAMLHAATQQNRLALVAPARPASAPQYLSQPVETEIPVATGPAATNGQRTPPEQTPGHPTTGQRLW